MKPLYRIRKTQDGDFYWIFSDEKNKEHLTSKNHPIHDNCIESIKISKDHLVKKL